MTMRTAKITGFKFSVNGIKVQKTVAGQQYEIPDDLYDVWKKGDYFETEEMEAELDIDTTSTEKPLTKAEQKAKKKKEAEDNKAIEANENK